MNTAVGDFPGRIVFMDHPNKSGDDVILEANASVQA
jgi:hypothetical protein